MHKRLNDKDQTSIAFTKRLLKCLLIYGCHSRGLGGGGGGGVGGGEGNFLYMG